MKKEEQLKESISTYLTLQYPDVIFRFDIGADIHLPVGLAKKSKRIHKHKKGYPDLFIAENYNDGHNVFCGLFIELKVDDFSKVYKKNGDFVSSKHVIEQANMLKKLNEKGYAALFTFGLDETIEMIDTYLSEDFNKMDSFNEKQRKKIEKWLKK